MTQEADITIQASFTVKTHYGKWAGCGGTSTCCQFNNPPWFCKQLPQPTTDDIELRLCANGSYFNDEDIAIEQVELYNTVTCQQYSACIRLILQKTKIPASLQTEIVFFPSS